MKTKKTMMPSPKMTKASATKKVMPKVKMAVKKKAC